MDIRLYGIGYMMKKKIHKYKGGYNDLKCISTFLLYFFIDFVAIIVVSKISYMLPDLLIKLLLIALGTHIFIVLHEFGHCIIYIIYGIAIQYIYFHFHLLLNIVIYQFYLK